jgi:hypothetical protein
MKGFDRVGHRVKVSVADSHFNRYKKQNMLGGTFYDIAII